MPLPSISIIGLGWLGLPLAISLKKENYAEIRGTSRNEAKATALKEKFAIDTYPLLIEGTETALPNYSPLFQSHIFVLNIPPGRGQDAVEQLYPQQIQLLLQAIINGSKQGENKPWVIFTSTTGVYGPQNALLQEDSPCAPQRDTAKAVYAAELLLNNYSQDIDSTILRLAGLVGAERQPGRFLAGKKNLDSGQTPVNLVHLTDLVSAVVLLIKKELKNDCFNICADEHPTHAQYYPAMCQLLGLEIPQFDNSSKTPLRVVDNSRFKQKSGFVYNYPNPLGFPV